MKYLLIAVVLNAGGDASGLYPTSWFDDEKSCVARGESMRDALVGTTNDGMVVEAVHFDCLGLTRLDIIIMGQSMPL